MFTGRWATIYDGFRIGDGWLMNWVNPSNPIPINVREDTLSEIYAFPGCKVTIWKDRWAEGDIFSCIGEGYSPSDPDDYDYMVYGPECKALQRQTGSWSMQLFDIGFGLVGNNAASTIICECA